MSFEGQAATKAGTSQILNHDNRATISYYHQNTTESKYCETDRQENRTKIQQNDNVHDFYPRQTDHVSENRTPQTSHNANDIMLPDISSLYQCPDKGCAKSFESVQLLNRHSQEAHIKMEYRCTVCGRLFQTSRSLKEHVIKTAHVNTKYLMQADNNIMSQKVRRMNSSEGQNHTSDPVASTSNTDEKCQSYWKGMTNLSSNPPENVSGTDKAMLICPEQGCDHWCQTLSHLAEHRKKCHVATVSERLYFCQEQGCDANFKTQKLLNTHTKTDHWENMLQCPTCEKRFVTRCALQAHETSHSTKSSEPCVCPAESCKNKIFQSQANLRSHQKSCHGERKYQCSECGSMFKTARDLKFHKTTHVTERLYECTEDGCDKTFKSAKHVRDHVRNVHKNRDLPCPVCGKMFRTRSLLRDHEAVHITTKSVVCPVVGCEKQFKTQKHLFLHKRNVHSEKRYPCPLCNQVFQKHWQLRAHKIEGHNADVKKNDTFGHVTNHANEGYHGYHQYMPMYWKH